MPNMPYFCNIRSVFYVSESLRNKEKIQTIPLIFFFFFSRSKISEEDTQTEDMEGIICAKNSLKNTSYRCIFYSLIHNVGLCLETFLKERTS